MPRGSRPGATRRSAFSLIELMLVMAALGLLATVVYMSWEAILPKTQLHTAVRELAATLSEARSDAISRGAEFRIEYYFTEEEGHPRGYRVVTPFRAGGQGGLAAWDDERVALPWRALPPSIEFASITIDGRVHTQGRCEVFFDARGSATDHTIALVQRGQNWENRYTIEVHALTGTVGFHEGEFLRDPPEDKDFR
jgi:prepilin-type N-terminal cleavage/methylation domain-containing protein